MDAAPIAAWSACRDGVTRATARPEGLAASNAVVARSIDRDDVLCGLHAFGPAAGSTIGVSRPTPRRTACPTRSSRTSRSRATGRCGSPPTAASLICEQGRILDVDDEGRARRPISCSRVRRGRGRAWCGPARSRGCTASTRTDTSRATRPTDGLSHDLVNEIVEDEAGSLWLSTYGGGLTRYRAGRFDRFAAARALARTSSTWCSWIVTAASGLRWTMADSDAFATASSRLHDPRRAAAATACASSWRIARARCGSAPMAAVSHGAQDGRITTFTTKDGLPSNLAFALTEDARGRLWVGTYNGGLSRWEQGRFRTIAERSARAQSVHDGDAGGSRGRDVARHVRRRPQADRERRVATVHDARRAGGQLRVRRWRWMGRGCCGSGTWQGADALCGWAVSQLHREGWPARRRDQRAVRRSPTAASGWRRSAAA